MSTLTTEYSSSVKVAQVCADFRGGLPNSGTVYVGAERHRVQVYRTAGGLMGKCACSSGCAAIPDAIRAVEIMAEAWKRTPRARAWVWIQPDSRFDPDVEPEQRKRRPYDGPARIMCEVDLVPMAIPGWAYDERGIRRPLLEAEIAQDLWYELHRALDRVLGGRRWTQSARWSPILKYYRASWEPNQGLTDAAFGDDPQSGLDDEQLEGSAA
jgi:hypothetical protein